MMLDNEVSDANYTKVHGREFSLSTAGNACKWAATHPSRDEYSLSKCVSSFQYAQSKSQQFRGHNLCWGNNNPQWLLDGNFSENELKSILEDHVTSVMKGLEKHGDVYAWDVVNEACVSNELYLASEKTSGFFKDNFWYPTLPNYVDVAFQAARKANPNTILMYNDFGQNTNVSSGGGKAEVVYDMVSDMINRKIPIDGVGLQQHLSVDDNYAHNITVYEEIITETIRSFVEDLNLIVHITEFDVKCPEPCDEDDLTKQAELYAAVLRGCLSNVNVNSTSSGCKSFETWGFTDKYSWLNDNRCPIGSGEHQCHALPYDENYVPKKAYDSMMSVLTSDAVLYSH